MDNGEELLEVFLCIKYPVVHVFYESEYAKLDQKRIERLKGCI